MSKMSQVTFTRFTIKAALAIDGVFLHDTSTEGSLNNESDLKNLFDYIDEQPKKFKEDSKRSKFLDIVNPAEIEIVKSYAQQIEKCYGIYCWDGIPKHIIDEVIIYYNVTESNGHMYEGMIVMMPLRELGKENIFFKLDHIKIGNGIGCVKDAEDEHDVTLHILKSLSHHFAEVKPDLIDLFVKNIRIRQSEVLDFI
jgi:hypothetical protein